MTLTDRAYRELFNKENETYLMSIVYSGKFSDYNANVRLRGNKLKFALSRNWEDVDEDIKIGLIQELMVKILCRRKKKLHTVNMDFYNNFLRALHLSVPKTKTNPLLEDSFHKINNLYFNGMLEIANLVIGSSTTRTLGQYNYQNDTITISKIFEEGPKELLDYVMHHEMLHKHLKFKCKNGRGHHHTPEFKKRERSYPNYELLEKQLNRHAYSCKRRNKRKEAPKPLFSIKRWF